MGAGATADTEALRVLGPGSVPPAMILVVDDEPAVNDLLCDALALAGHDTCRARHGLEALHLLRTSTIDLVILDINMPMMSGFEVLERMRAGGDTTPVIVLTARQDRTDTKAGFELGADDFVRKPFGIEELTLRVAAVLRRTRDPQRPSTLALGSVVMDLDQHEVSSAGVSVALSPTEFRLLEYLVRHSGRVLPRQELLAAVWGLPSPGDTSVLDTYVSYLRRKLGDGMAIRTVRGVGYQARAGD